MSFLTFKSAFAEEFFYLKPAHFYRCRVLRDEFLLGIFPPDHGGNHAPAPAPTPAPTAK